MGAGDNQTRRIDAARIKRSAHIEHIAAVETDQVAHGNHRNPIIEAQRKRAHIQVGVNRCSATVILKSSQEYRTFIEIRGGCGALRR